MDHLRHYRRLLHRFICIRPDEIQQIEVIGDTHAVADSVVNSAAANHSGAAAEPKARFYSVAKAGGIDAGSITNAIIENDAGAGNTTPGQAIASSTATTHIHRPPTENDDC